MQDVASLAEEIVQGKGYVLLPELFTPREISEARLHLLNLATEQPAGRFLKTGERSRLCLCWHDTSINHSDQPRVSVLGNYNPKFIRPLENPAQYMSPAFIEQASPKLRQLLGYEFHAAIFKDVQRLQRNDTVS